MDLKARARGRGAIGRLHWTQERRNPSYHIHDQNTVGVKLFNSPFWRHSYGTNEKPRFSLNDDINQLRQLAVGVICVGLARVASDLREKKIDSEWGVLVMQKRLEFGDLLLEEVGSVKDSSNYTKSA